MAASNFGHHPMDQSILLIFVSCQFFHVRGQEPAKPDSGVLHTFHPSSTLVIGIFLGMLSVTLVLLVYLRFYPANMDDDFGHASMLSGLMQNFNGIISQRSMSSGIDRTVIESIPFFHFSALKGSKEGLECAVCLTEFEDSDILRFLPKCKHAFHMNCIDRWLEIHSTCPLCRYKFDSRDLNTLIQSNSIRLSPNPSNLTEDPNVELFVERELDSQVQRSSSRFSIGSSFRGIDGGKKQELLIQQGEGSGEDDLKLLHKFKHKIIVSDVVIKSRWSDVTPSDLLSLSSEMLSAESSRRFSALESNSRRFSIGLSTRTSKQIEKGKEDLERDRMSEPMFGIHDRNDSSSNFPSASYEYDESNSSMINHTRKRSVSEITTLPRVQQFSMENQISPVSHGGKEERIRRIWLPIVRRTVHWFSGQERQSHVPQNNRQSLNI